MRLTAAAGYSWARSRRLLADKPPLRWEGLLALQAVKLFGLFLACPTRALMDLPLQFWQRMKLPAPTLMPVFVNALAPCLAGMGSIPETAFLLVFGSFLSGAR